MLLKFSISVNLRFQKTKTKAPLLVNLFYKKYIYLSMSPSYFYQSVLLICTTFMLSYFMEFFWDVCFYVFLFVVLMLFCCCFCSFLYCFHFWPKFLLTVKIQPLRCWIKYKSNNCGVGIDIEDSIYSRELSVQQIL